jgi:hypothetical protein
MDQSEICSSMQVQYCADKGCIICWRLNNPEAAAASDAKLESKHKPVFPFAIFPEEWCPSVHPCQWSMKRPCPNCWREKNPELTKLHDAEQTRLAKEEVDHFLK